MTAASSSGGGGLCFWKPEQLLFLWMFSRLESRMSADIEVIMQLLQRQTHTIPPSYSTLTSASSILTPTAASLPDIQQPGSPPDRTTTDPQQLFNDKPDQLPLSPSSPCGPSVPRRPDPPPLTQGSPIQPSPPLPSQTGGCLMVSSSPSPSSPSPQTPEPDLSVITQGLTASLSQVVFSYPLHPLLHHPLFHYEDKD